MVIAPGFMVGHDVGHEIILSADGADFTD